MVNLSEIKVNLPKIEKVKVSRVVLISGMLTFLYLIEFCLGIRSVYHTFSLWNSSPYASQNTQVVSWTLCVACLLVCVTSSFTANLISAMWEQKQLKEKGQEKSAIRFAFHIIVGGMIWRYVCLWFSDKKELQKKEAMLLTMAKFIFTQFYTIPMIIVSASLLEDFQEIIYDLCAVACVSITLLLTCIMFSWCKAEVDDLKKWSFETVDLVPLIFCQSSDDSQKSSSVSNSVENKESGNSVAEVSNQNDDAVEIAFLRIIVLLQTFSFTFGRLLALGILLRLAGIYAVSIMFLQLLISVVYLKFQVPFLVSDSLPKWRQLCRLAFMSYILIFEWHLNRDPKTGYDFTSNIKHSMLYYLIATLESIFYFVTWAITESYISSNYLDYLSSSKRKFVRNLIVIGSMSLVFSLTIYILLMFWQSRRLSKLLHSLQRRYLNSKLKIVNNGSRNGMERKSECKSGRPHISNPIAINTTTDISSTNDEVRELEKHSSYRDLREPIDDEIELYVRNGANANGFKTSLEEINNDTEKSPVTKMDIQTIKRVENSNMEEKSDDEKFERVEIDEFEEDDSEVRFSPPESCTSSPAFINVSKNKSYDSSADKSVKSDEKSASPSLKSDKNCSAVDISTNAPSSTVKLKMAAISESMSEGWNKFSSLSLKFTGAMQGQIQKRKEQFQNFRSPSGNDNNERQSSKKSSNTCTTEAISATDSNCEQTMTKNSGDDSSEGYFMGDYRCPDGKIYQSNQDINNDCADTETEEEENEPVKRASVVNLYEEASDPEPIHCEGDEPCPCFVCRTIGDGQILRRRRSSSVPLPERKTRCNMSSRVFPEESSIARFASTSNIVEMDATSELRDGKTKEIDISHVPKLYIKGSFQNLSLISLENRIEHYV
ncbi:hypothetical protein AVEN_58703-1 [Araneus ventricosus]|uniref:XK-related protein n=1 Tax=Araneus ventricosus TaxID=182803 RepID=A0A4Y2JEE8_ARAVE|nr:hypothetical protein AVEN_58703-1 [Araneus ventricosus]